MASAAKLYFDEILAGGVTLLESLPGNPEPVIETEWRDFQQEESKSLKEAWSEMLSGFANTEGGVVVWGVRAKKEKGNPMDCVTGLDKVLKPAEWAERLRGWLLEATDPPVSGVVIKPIPEVGGPGFVVCHIPESQHKPHRAEFLENKPYKIRTGSNFIDPNPSHLRSMFFPQPQRSATITLDVARDFQHGTANTIFFTLANTGYQSLRKVVVRFALREPSETSERRQWHIYQLSYDAQVASVGQRPDATCFLPTEIHPGTSVRFAYLQSNLPNEAIGFSVTVFQSDAAPMGFTAQVDFNRHKGKTIKLIPIGPEELLALEAKLGN